MTPQEAAELRRSDATAWGNKASIDWRDLPDAHGYTYWQREAAQKEGRTLAAPDRQPQEMTISAIPPNTKMVEAQDKNNRTHTVEVGNNSNFAIGDVIRVGPHESGYSDVWTLLSGVPDNLRRPVDSSNDVSVAIPPKRGPGRPRKGI